MLCYVIRKSIAFSVIPSILFYHISYTNTYDFNFFSPFCLVQYVCVCGGNCTVLCFGRGYRHLPQKKLCDSSIVFLHFPLTPHHATQNDESNLNQITKLPNKRPKNTQHKAQPIVIRMESVPPSINERKIFRVGYFRVLCVCR